MRDYRLETRYPGSKRLYDFGDRRYGTIVEQFGGSAAYGLKAFRTGKCDRLIIAECEPTLHALYYCWQHGLGHHVTNKLRRFQAQCKTAEDVQKLFRDLIAIMDTCPTISAQGYSKPKLAAIGRTVRFLAFGGVLRDNQSGRLNIAPSKAQAEKFLNWGWECPPSQPGFEVVTDWRECLTDPTLKRVHVLSDPPYYADPTLGRMTPAYRGHKPHDPETLQLAIDAVADAVNHPGVERVTITNYYSHALDLGLADLAARSGVPLKLVEQGIELGSMNKRTSHRKHGKRANKVEIQQREATWEIDHAIAPQVKQLALL